MKRELQEIQERAIEIHKKATMLHQYCQACETSQELYNISSTVCFLAQQSNKMLHILRLMANKN